MSIVGASRDVRRAAVAQERRERNSGKWSPFVPRSSDDVAKAHISARKHFGTVGGWAQNLNRAYANGWCSVIVRTVTKSGLGVEIEHAAIVTASATELGWKEKQRIKDEVFGPDRMAIEVFPRREDLIDAADMYHLWVFPIGYRFDFGLGKAQK